MKCETIRNLISSYIDKDLNDIEKTELEEHLAECQQCREEFDSMLDIMAVCNNLEELELPQSFRTELHQRLVEEKKKRNLFTVMLGGTGRKMATGLVAAALVLAIGIGGSSLLSVKNGETAQQMEAYPGYGIAGAPAEPASDSVTNFAMKAEEGVSYDMSEMPQSPAAPPPEAESKQKELSRNAAGVDSNGSLIPETSVAMEQQLSSRSGRMVIRTGNISLNVENVDKSADSVKQLVANSGGYIENSQVDVITVPRMEYTDGKTVRRESTEKQANMTVRVPEAQFQGIFNSIKDMGELVSENISGSDITTEYRDTQARVDNLKIQEASLRQLLTKAESVEEILKIETELNRVRTEIDINSGSLRHWDDLVQLSTIYIYMRELKPEELKSVDVPGTWDKANQGFIKAINNIVAGFEGAAIFLVAAIPYLVVVVVLGAIGLYIARRIRLKKKQ